MSALHTTRITIYSWLYPSMLLLCFCVVGAQTDPTPNPTPATPEIPASARIPDGIDDAHFKTAIKLCIQGDDFFAQNLLRKAQWAWTNCIRNLKHVARANDVLLRYISEKENQLSALTRVVEREDAREKEKRRIEAERQAEIEKEAARQRNEQEREQRRLAAERQAERQRQQIKSEVDDLEAIRAKKPRRLRSGGFPPIVAYLNDVLHNPASLRVASWSEPRLFQDADLTPGLGYRGWFWIVRVRYRARNAFNALILTETDFYIRGDRVVRSVPVE